MLLIIILLIIVVYLLFNQRKPKKIKIEYEFGLVNERQRVIDNYIHKSLRKEITNDKIIEMCSYALDSGKKVRPVICLSVFKALSGGPITEYIIEASLAIEYIHCSSLIIDDIMDGDTTRRGKKSVYAKYGTTMAQLTALILCALAFTKFSKSLNILMKNPNTNRDVPLQCITLVSNTIQELCMGQFLDINMVQNNIKTMVRDSIKHNDIIDLINKKTSSLFEMCFYIPWLYVYGTDLDHIKPIAQNFGLLFQISDDFEDIEQDARSHGKNSVMNYAINKGIQHARNDYYIYLKDFINQSRKYDIYTKEINEITDYLTLKMERYYLYHLSNKTKL